MWSKFTFNVFSDVIIQCRDMASRKRSIADVAADTKKALQKEWDEALCPICMDHPHNVVLLLCSSHEKGCRPYICDTSYRHSNCLDRFKNLKSENTNTSTLPTSSLDNNISNLSNNGEIVSTNGSNEGCGTQMKGNLRCPLCRGAVLGCKIDEEARTYLNQKHRSCSCENCSFSGNYRELRRHARRAHPSARPSNIDPSRQQAWRRLEHQREYNDIVSAIRSAMPGAVVMGDFVVEDGERESLSERDGNGNGPWLTSYFLLEMMGSVDSGANRSRARARSSGTSSRRRYLWGENLLGLRYDDGDDDDGDEEDRVTNVLRGADDDLSPVPRRRRRFTRSVSDEDQL